MTTSRRLFGSSALVAIPVALAGCAWVEGLTTTAGAAAGAAAVTRIVGYIQAGITALSSTVAIFGSKMSASAQAGIADAMDALEAAAASVGAAVSAAASGPAIANKVDVVVKMLKIAVDAVLAGLAFIPGAGVALVIAREVATFIPVIAAFVASILTPTATVPVPTTASQLPAAAKHLGVIMR